MANKHMERYSISLIIREMQIKTTARFHFAPIMMAMKTKQKITSIGKDVEKLGPLCTVGGIVKLYNCCKKLYGGSSKI